MLKKPRFRIGLVLIALLAVAVLVTTVGAFLTSIDAPQSTGPQPKPEVQFSAFNLATPSQPDSQDGGVRVVASPVVTVSGQVANVRSLTVLYGAAGASSADRATAQPDASGHFEATLRLSQTGVVYAIDAYGLVADRQIPDWKGGFFDERPAIEAPAALRVKVVP